LRGLKTNQLKNNHTLRIENFHHLMITSISLNVKRNGKSFQHFKNSS